LKNCNKNASLRGNIFPKNPALQTAYSVRQEPHASRIFKVPMQESALIDLSY
jgi:hypothetical protein